MTDLLQTYMPHAHCYGGDPLIFWSWVVGDVLTAVAYSVLPVALAVLYRRRPDILPGRIVMGFAAFILLCGVGHGLDALGQWWWPAYRLRALWGLVTAVVSLWTAWTFVRLLPALSAMATQEQVQRMADAALDAPPGTRSSIEDTIAAVLESTEEHRWARRLARRVMECRIGICEVSPEGVIQEIDGGALAAVGARREDWIGLQLEDPVYLNAIARAMEGKTTTFAQADPVTGRYPQLVQYGPWGGDTGHPSGATVVWIVGKDPAETFEVRRGE